MAYQSIFSVEKKHLNANSSHFISLFHTHSIYAVVRIVVVFPAVRSAHDIVATTYTTVMHARLQVPGCTIYVSPTCQKITAPLGLACVFVPHITTANIYSQKSKFTKNTMVEVGKGCGSSWKRIRAGKEFQSQNRVNTYSKVDKVY